MSYPQSTEYQAAVQNPQQCFTDPELKGGVVRTNPLGLPHPLSGGFALTYSIENSGRRFAVRCFHREVSELQDRYEKISKKIASLKSECFVDFSYDNRGIIVSGQKFPIVKMDWAEGETLGAYVEDNFSNTAKVQKLRDQFRNLYSFLETHEIAHGDIQDLNVICTSKKITLIDYDGMFVKGLPLGFGNEIGHKDFQHPERTPKQFGPKMDRFSFIAIEVMLSAIIERPSVYRKFKGGGEALLFRANDYKDPDQSALFRELLAIDSISGMVRNFRAICLSNIADIPTLKEFLSGQNIPVVALTPTKHQPARPAKAHYISSYDVIDASRYDLVSALVGEKIELVGRVVAVHSGHARKGKGRGKPYVFINFGDWRSNCVKLTIWSEGLSKFSTQPGEDLVGKWISVVGLIDPPYHAKNYSNIGITIDRESQIEQITESEAKYRLGSTTSKTEGKPGSATVSNKEVLKNLKIPAKGQKTGTVGVTSSPPPNKQPRVTKNQAILKNLAPQPTTISPVKTPASSTGPTVPRKTEYSANWVFWVVGIGLLVLFFGFQ